MFKFKNFKILLLLMLFAFAGNNAWGGGVGGDPTYTGWHTYTAKIKVNETGLGKVYGSFGTTDDGSAHNPTAARNAYIVVQHRYAKVYTEDKSSNEYNLYLYAIANESTEEGVSYEFVEWQNEKGERVATSNQVEGTATISQFVTTNTCGPGFDSSQGTGKTPYQPHVDYHNAHKYTDEETGQEVVGDHGIDSTYIAVFRRVYKTRLVTVSINDENLGLVECNPTPFDFGTEVTLRTFTKEEKDKGFENKFIGWKKDGEFMRDANGDIVRDAKLQFTVSEDTKGHYEAVYESGYKFFHLVNKSTQRTVNAINDQGSITDFSSLQLVAYDERLFNAGSVFQINNYAVAGGYPHEFIVQGANTGDWYTIDPGRSEYITINRNIDDLTWSIHPNGQPVYMADEGGSNVTAYGAKEDDIAHWYIDPIDKDLETKENYFSLDPAKLVQVGDKYYTTLRTSWNILFNPEQMTPYIVKSVDETEGTFEMEPITGNIIPLGTPVIIETKSNDVEENRMVPTLTNAASGAVPSGNLLQTSTKYFPNQRVSGNYKALMVNGDGQLAFGGKALGTVNGNEAYLQVDNEVVLKPADDLPALATLKAIESSDEKGKLYVVEDELIAVAYAVNEQDNSVLLWCKDQAESNQKTTKEDSQFDYMKDQYAKLKGKNAPESWDQSNWVALKFVPNSAIGIDAITARLRDDVVGHCLNPKAVTGTYSDDVNYTITVAMPQEAGKTIFDGAVGKEAGYQENLYCTANFLSVNLNAETQPSYYFVNPKIQEVAEVTFAVWNGSCFVAPAHQDNFNAGEISGAFNVDWRYNNPNNPILADNQAYQFLAVVQRPVSQVEAISPKDEVSPSTSKPDGTYMVFPLNLDPSSEEHVITSVAAPVVNKTVSRVIYYNLMGVASTVPFQGVNIVVTEYSDGTRQARKMVKR